MEQVYSPNLDRFGRQDQWSGPSGTLIYILFGVKAAECTSLGTAIVLPEQ